MITELNHERARVNTMTDDQLIIRYGKMTKIDKIEALHTVLVETNRCPAVRNSIELKHPHLIQPGAVPTNTSTEHWIKKSDQMMSFTEMFGDKKIRVRTYKFDGATVSGLVNDGELGVDEARSVWCYMIKDGWEIYSG